MQSITKYVLAFVAVMLLLVITSAPLRASDTDNRIESSGAKSYVFKTYLKDDAVKVRCDDGKVTLTGTVSEESHKAMAEETMMSLPGVKSVNNQLEVTSSPAGTGSDERIGQHIRGMLRMHRSVSNDDTRVTVTDGNVMLRGTASSEAQKQLTTEYAKDVSGVKDVDNQMIVAKSPAKSHRSVAEKIDDASVTTQVRMSLLFHHGTDVFDTKVSTHKGCVTLAGTAKNQAEIDLATKRVADVHGVKSVDNQMRIERSQSTTD